MFEILGDGGTCTINAAANLDAAAPKTFTSIAYNGGILATGAYPKGIIVDLAGMKSVKRVVANLDHNKSARVGHITAIRNDLRTLEVDGTLSAATPAREEVIASARDGFEWQNSVEVMPKRIEHIAAGKTVEVNGQTFTGPIPIARESSFYGLAFVGQGADENTSAKIAASAENSKKVETMNVDLQKWIEASGFDVSVLTDAQKAALQKSYEAEIKAAADVGNHDHKPIVAKFDIDELKAAYAGHEAKIEAAIFKAAGQVSSEKLSEIKASALSGAVALKSKAVENEWSAMQFNIEAIQKLGEVHVQLIRAERPQGPAIHASTRDVSNAVIEAGLAQTVGLPDIEKSYDDKTLQAAHTAFRGRLGLQQLVIMAACANGMHIGHGERLNSGNLRDALQYAFPGIHAASTLSLPGILSNVLNKELLVGYMEEDQTWREISRIAPVNDFKTNRSYRLLDSMEYEELAPDGTIRHGTTGEEFYTREADTYAKMFSITRKDLINDDLGAFDDVRSRLGRGAAQKFNNLFWSKFINNSTFFTSGRTNYISGATSTLLTDGVGLAMAVQQFRKLKSPTADAAKRVGGTPTILLVPPELEAAADKLFMGEKLNVGTAAGEENIYRNKYRPVVVPWLSEPAFTGNSATAWYLFRDPRILAPMAVSFLNGNQTPTVESAEADFNTLGIQFRGYHDFGCDPAEYLSGIKSKGAA